MVDIVCVSAEGFLLKNEFICKEFCLVNCASHFLYHTTIKSVKKFSDYSTNEQQKIQFDSNSFEFDCGDIEINEFIDHVFPMIKGKKVVVVHTLTVDWMKNIFQKYGDIDCVAVGKWFEDEPCMNDDLKDTCHYHDEESILVNKCALFNALGLNKGISVVLPHLKNIENTFCISLAGFNLHDYGFICKEICVLSLDSKYSLHVTIKSPEKGVSSHCVSLVRFETSYGNGLSFNCGELTLNELKEKLIPVIGGKKVLVKSWCHLFWLQKLFRNYVDFQFINARTPYDSLFFESPDCPHHKPVSKKPKLNKYCAKRQATILRRNVLHLFEQTKVNSIE